MPQLISSGREDVWPRATQLLLWQCVFPLLGPPFSSDQSAALPRVHTASCQTLAGQEVSWMLLKMTKASLTCGWITAKKQHETFIRDGSDKELADPFHTGQIHLKP